MSRYIKNVARIAASLGPTEERGFRVWVGYDVAGVDGEVEGLINVDGLPDEEIERQYGVTSFTPIEPERLGIRRN